MSVARIAHRYAKSLIELSVSQNKLERTLQDVQSFQAAITNRDFYLFLKSPIIHSAKKLEVVDKLFGSKYDELTMAFMHILINKGREMFLPEITNEFIQEYKKYKHITTVHIVTAAPISEDTIAAIRRKLATSSETNDNLEIKVSVNPNLLGGFVIEFDDQVYDASLQHKLNKLKKEFENNLYISQITAR